MNIESLYQLYSKQYKVTTDSRNVPSGSIYFAIQGDRFDGNAFANNALGNGAAYAIIDKKEYFIDERTICVENTLETLQKLANYHRRKLGIPIIAITGTNGKTTTKELMRSVLEQKFKVCATLGNLNNHLGVPITLLSMNPEIEMGVIEMGANHPGEIRQLCQIAEPNYGLITNIGKAHLDGFGGFQGVIKAKKELYDYLIAQDGIVFLNSGNNILTELLEEHQLKSVTYGLSDNQCQGSIIESDPYLIMSIANRINESDTQKIQIRTNLVGQYNAENVMAAACVGLYFKIQPEKIQTAIEQYVPTNNRSQLKNTEKNRLLLDYYNANPSSTEVAVTNFLNIEGSNKVIILGDMLELGEESVAEHSNILKRLAGIKDCKVLLVGPYYKELASNFGFTAFSKAEELRDWISLNPIEQSFILIKGSRGIQLEKILDQL
jgi:UDP-N-acetylmuramoyl-tripeptide--D-alanyl-D-alanine ligase